MNKRAKDIDEGPGINVGVIMTISLFLILLTFFVLLNSIAVIDERKSWVAIGSLLGAFGSSPSGLSLLKSGDLTLPPSAPMIVQKLDVDELLSLMDKKIEGEIKVGSSKSKEIITIQENALFGEDKSKLKLSSYPVLDEICRVAKKGDYLVEIIGHTDNRPAEEMGYKSNWEISTFMAIQVLKYFVDKGQVPAGRLAAYGYGSQKPIKSNETRQSRAQNRRVEIILNYEMPAHLKRIFWKKPEGLFTYKKFNFRVF
jgi:chemotaxis protein MotB